MFITRLERAALAKSANKHACPTGTHLHAAHSIQRHGQARTLRILKPMLCVCVCVCVCSMVGVVDPMPVAPVMMPSVQQVMAGAQQLMVGPGGPRPPMGPGPGQGGPQAPFMPPGTHAHIHTHTCKHILWRCLTWLQWGLQTTGSVTGAGMCVCVCVCVCRAVTMPPLLPGGMMPHGMEGPGGGMMDSQVRVYTHTHTHTHKSVAHVRSSVLQASVQIDLHASAPKLLCASLCIAGRHAGSRQHGARRSWWGHQARTGQ